VTTSPKPGRPVVLPGAPEWDIGKELRVGEVANPLPDATLGEVRKPARVRGPERFARTLLSVALDPDDLVGIDASSVRVFRVDEERRAFVPVWRSGVALGLDRVWAEIHEPGVYLAVGLPRDRVLRQAMRALALRRRGAGGRALRDAGALVRSYLEPAVRSPGARAAVMLAEITTTTNALLPRAARRGRGGGLVPFPWPHDASDDEIAERIAGLQPPADGLPEEALFFGPETTVARAVVPWPGAIDWPMYHHDQQHSGIVLGSRIDSLTVRGLRLRWAQQLYGPVISVPALVGGKAFVGNGNSRLAPNRSGGTLFRVDLASGVIENGFTFATPPGAGSRQGFTGIACTPAIAYGRVYVSCQDGRIRCIDAQTMALIWSTDLRHADPAHNQPVTHRVSAEGWSSPLVVDGRVYVGFGESESNTPGFVYCLDAATGWVIWLFCTVLLPGAADNEPNVVPRSVVGIWPLPPGYTVSDDASHVGAAPWSSCAYDPGSNRICVGTGNVLPQGPLPQPKYCLGLLSLDAATGGAPRFFQPANADCYRPDDSDVDVGASPTVFLRGGRRIVSFGFKGGSFFLLDADTLEVLRRRQMLPRAGGNGGFPGDDGELLPDIDPHPFIPGIGDYTENFYGVFGAPGLHYGLRRLYVGVGGFAFGENQPGIDTRTTPFLRSLNWQDLTDAWPTAVGPDKVRRYVNATPPLYTTEGEAGFSSPVVVNDVVLASTSRPGLYAFDAAMGTPLWSAAGLGPPVPNSYTLGPAVSGDVVVLGSANLGLLGYSL
jgi:outer membrane protein assembly factor BamB